MHTLSKDSIRSPRKIDAAMAAVLSWKARGDCIEAGAVWIGDDPPAPTAPRVYAANEAPPAEEWTDAETVGPMGPMS